MKAVLACALLLIVIEAECYWRPRGHNFPWKRPIPRPPFPYEGYSNKPQNSEWYFHRIQPGQENTVNLGPGFRNAEWICHNLKTDDMMIVKVENSDSDETKMNEQPQHPPFGHPPKYWNQHQYENEWHNPINGHPSLMNEGDKESSENTDSTTSSSVTDHHSRETQEDESFKYHDGKGLIDIRTGRR